MKMALYQAEFRLRTSDFDCYDRLTPSAILDLFQDVAGHHADHLGVGFQRCIEQDLIWVLLRTRYEVFREPALYETVVVQTWPEEKGRLDFNRDYKILDLNGNVLVKGQSKWVVVNLKTRRLSLQTLSYNLDTMWPEKTFENAFPKLNVEDLMDATIIRYQTTFLDLDHNMHINNTKYVNYLYNALQLPSNQKIAFFEINYVKEMKENSPIIIRWKKVDNKYLLQAFDEQEALTFVSEVTIKEESC